ncbi:MAG TPA: antibiotic biosynthesis monooxygenase [Longimicrobium sp.]|nr:antibiotic biosynthesis monooxygenase [Longimicrobium sp.]
MIARVWRGEVRADDANAYARYLRATGEPDCRTLPGNRGVLILRRDGEERTEFVFVSFWSDMAAIRAFAGEDVERARYYPEDERYLLALDPHVRHFDVTTAGIEFPAVNGG